MPPGLLLSRAKQYRSRAEQYRVELTATCVTPPRAPTASAPTAGLSCASLGQRFPHSQGDGFCQPAPTVSERHTFGIREQIPGRSRAATRILGRRRPTSDGSGSPAPKTASWRRRTMTARTGDDETTGSSDVSLWGSGDLAHVAAQRRTSAPLPPPTPCGGIYVRRPRRAAASSSGAYTCLTAVDTGHRLWIGMDTRDLELFHCPGTATPAAPWGVCTGTERNGSTANDQDIITAAQAVRSR